MHFLALIILKINNFEEKYNKFKKYKKINIVEY